MGPKEPPLALVFGTFCGRACYSPSPCAAEAALPGWNFRAAFDALQSLGAPPLSLDAAFLRPAALTAHAQMNASCRFGLR